MAPFTRWVTDTHADAKENRLLIKHPKTTLAYKEKDVKKKKREIIITIIASCHNKFSINVSESPIIQKSC